jgi:hypothetical protein
MTLHREDLDFEEEGMWPLTPKKDIYLALDAFDRLTAVYEFAPTFYCVYFKLKWPLNDQYEIIRYEPSDRWQPLWGRFVVGDVLVFTCFAILRGVGELAHQELLVAAGYAYEDESWALVTRKKIGPKMWDAAINDDTTLISRRRTGNEPTKLCINTLLPPDNQTPEHWESISFQ